MEKQYEIANIAGMAENLMVKANGRVPSEIQAQIENLYAILFEAGMGKASLRQRKRRALKSYYEEWDKQRQMSFF